MVMVGAAEATSDDVGRGKRVSPHEAETGRVLHAKLKVHKHI